LTFREHLKEGRFTIQKCGIYGMFIYAGLLCTACSVSDLGWLAAKMWRHGLIQN
jgi:hypothetical protein